MERAEELWRLREWRNISEYQWRRIVLEVKCGGNNTTAAAEMKRLTCPGIMERPSVAGGRIGLFFCSSEKYVVIEPGDTGNNNNCNGKTMTRTTTKNNDKVLKDYVAPQKGSQKNNFVPD
jgi:hypothetical protein